MNQRRNRLVASIAAAAVIAIGATGCSLDPRVHATTREYSAAEGINVPGFGTVTVRNVVFIANDEGTEGNLIAAVINRGTTDASVDFKVGEQTQSVEVPANTIVSLGVGDTVPLLFTLEGTATKPGADTPVTVNIPGQDAETIPVPIVDGTLEYFAPFVP